MEMFDKKTRAKGAECKIRVTQEGQKEDFNICRKKVVVAVDQLAYRALIKFTEEELDYIVRS